MSSLSVKQYFAKRLKALRDERGWTLQELADKIGISSQMVWIYEQGDSDPPLSRVVQFAQVFNVPAETLYPEHAVAVPTAEEASRA
jgi:transcriptional regulator with XRE-family HTH domain